GAAGGARAAARVPRPRDHARGAAGRARRGVRRARGSAAVRPAVRGLVLVLLLAGAAGFLVDLGDQLGDRPIELLWGRALLVGLVGALGGLGPALTISALLHALRARPDGRCAAVGAVAGALLAAGLVAAAPPRLTLARLLEGAPI